MDRFFEPDALWFTVPAFLGTAVFALRLVLMLAAGVGGDLHFDAVDAAHGGGLDALGHGHDGALGHHVDGDAGAALKLLSFQSITAFLMGFGWAGLGALLGTGWEAPAAVVAGLVGGVAMMYLVAWLLRTAHRMEASGNVSIRSAQGAEGDIYVTVPAGGKGRGQVRINLGQRQRYFDAVAEEGSAELRTGMRVRVLRVNDDRTLTVGAA